ncbi:MAG TPA: pyridoxamine 5'-phosphate oxidase family protein [Actinomycetota bacterium]
MSDDLDVLRRMFRDQPACRVGTVRPDGGPYVAVRWFVWLDDEIWVSTRSGDSTWEHVLRDPRVSIVIDRGRDWAELAGVRIEGVAEMFPAEHPDLRGPMSAWHEKYRSMLGGDSFERLTRDVVSLGFLRVAPSRVDAWDHR